MYLVQVALHAVYAKHPNLSRNNYVVLAECDAQWKLHDLADNVARLVARLQIDRLDALLLPASSAFYPSDSCHQRKAAVLALWQKMIHLRDERHLVQHIGVCDFPIQELELLFTAFPKQPPQLLSVETSVAVAVATTGDDDAATAAPHQSGSETLDQMLAFAHARQMDVVVRFPFRTVDALPLPTADRWHQLTRAIAQRHARHEFLCNVTNESERESFHVETIKSESETTLQVVHPYFSLPTG